MVLLIPNATLVEGAYAFDNDELAPLTFVIGDPKAQCYDATFADYWSQFSGGAEFSPCAGRSAQDRATESSNGGTTESSAPARDTNSPPPISVNARIRVISPPLRVRNGPGLQAETVGVQEDPVSGTVLSDPYWVDGYWWFEIDYDEGADGWSGSG